ncbi:BrnA antitoxin family protein [Falsirhodobacter sp. 1013]|uniref:BrnA antitoxin family protein n=1 Tax=Falsirhodobacter sp. 1013 TaxID=3417566 RepID=UPI003EB91BB4
MTDSDNPEWTTDDFAKAKPASELPAHIRAAFPRTRGPQKAPPKVPVSIRLSADVVEHFKAGGPGWQSRIDEALRKVVGV